jgi:SAM-dependent methyltransferase
MRKEEHRTLYALEDTYWWFVGRRAIIAGELARLAPSPGERILDVGCGTGANLRLLNLHGTATGLDPSAEALRLCRERGLTRLVAGGIEALPIRDGAVGLATAFEVLEHVADDAAAMAELGRVVRPGGCVLVTVPAYGFLWSEHDEALDHKRRYSAGQVRRLAEAAGLRVERLPHCTPSPPPPILAFRVAQRALRLVIGRRRRPATAHIPMPRPVSALFVWLLRVEAALLRVGRLPFGVSILCVARKPEAPCAEGTAGAARTD